MGLLGQGDYGGGLKAVWDSQLCKGLAEDPGEDPSQLDCKIHQHTTRYAIWTSCPSRVGKASIDNVVTVFLMVETVF